MTDKVDSSVVMAQLQVSFRCECDNQGLSTYGRPFFCLPSLVADWAQDVYYGFYSGLD